MNSKKIKYKQANKFCPSETSSASNQHSRAGKILKRVQDDVNRENPTLSCRCEEKRSFDEAIQMG